MSNIAAFGGAASVNVSTLTRVYDRTLEGQTADEIINLSPESMYLAVCEENAISTGKVYGCRAWLVATPDAESMGSTAVTRLQLAHTSNAGVATSAPADSTIRWRCASSAYRVRMVVYKL